MSARIQSMRHDRVAFYGSLMRGLGAAETLGVQPRLRYVGAFSFKISHKKLQVIV